MELMPYEDNRKKIRKITINFVKKFYSELSYNIQDKNIKFAELNKKLRIIDLLYQKLINSNLPSFVRERNEKSLDYINMDATIILAELTMDEFKIKFLPYKRNSWNEIKYQTNHRFKCNSDARDAFLYLSSLISTVRKTMPSTFNSYLIELSKYLNKEYVDNFIQKKRISDDGLNQIKFDFNNIFVEIFKPYLNEETRNYLKFDYIRRCFEK